MRQRNQYYEQRLPFDQLDEVRDPKHLIMHTYNSLLMNYALLYGLSQANVNLFVRAFGDHLVFRLEELIT